MGLLRRSELGGNGHSQYGVPHGSGRRGFDWPAIGALESPSLTHIGSESMFTKTRRLVTMRTTFRLLACIAFVTLIATSALAQERVTFAKDVAPILQQRCQVCHHPGTVAPMSLVTYEQTRPWAKSIRTKVVAREMPPWFIDKNVGVQHFSNDMSLSDQEIATITKWVDDGAPLGNPADMPAPRQFPDELTWQIGKPDVVLSLPKDRSE